MCPFLSNLQNLQKCYIDSGVHSLTSIDNDCPVFVLIFCIFKKDTYITVIDKKLLNRRYLKAENPYHIALRFCLERLYKFLNKYNQMHMKIVTV